MGTNEIVNDIINRFINQLEGDNLIKKDFIEKLGGLLHSNEKVTALSKISGSIIISA